MESSASKQDLLELLLLLAHLTPIQLKALCQFVQISPDSQAEENILALQPILSKGSEDQIASIIDLAKQSEENEGDDEDNPPSKEEIQLSKEMNLSAKKMRTVISSMGLLLSLQQLEDLLQNLSVAQLMKMFEVLPQAPPVQQLQLLQQIQQLFGQLQPQVLLTLRSQIESAEPGSEHTVLSSLLNLPAEYFQLYQPLRLLLQLDSTELASLQNVLPNLLPAQILQLLQLLQLQPFDVLELRSLFHPDESQSDFMSMEDGGRDPSSDPSAPTQKEIGLQIVDQPPEKSVYKRNLKPNPMVALTGDPKLNDGNLYVAPLLIRCDSFTEEPKYLTGNRPVRVTNGRVVTFRKLKIMTTSHQQQETLFCIKFELRRYTGEEIYEVIDAIHSNPINVLSHSTQMKPVPTLAPTIEEVIPNKGPVAGGTRVAIIGASFVDSPSARIRFDNVDVMPIFHGGGTLICHTPQHQEGTVNVTVSNSAKKWSETVATFTYDSKCTNFVPPTGFSSNFPMSDGNASSSNGSMHDRVFQMGDGSMSDVEKFSRAGGNLEDRDERSYTLLHYASSQGNFQLVERLIDLGCDLDNGDRIGRNAMHFAAMEDRCDVVSRLLKDGADPCRQEMSTGATPLISAIAMGSSASAHVLIEDGRSINISDMTCASPLHIAISMGDADVIRHLCMRGAWVNFQDENGETPLHYAVRSGNFSAAAILLQFSASPVVQDEDGETPMEFSIEFSETALFQLLHQYQGYFQLENVDQSSRSLRNFAPLGNPFQVETQPSYFGVDGESAIGSFDDAYAHSMDVCFFDAPTCCV